MRALNFAALAAFVRCFSVVGHFQNDHYLFFVLLDTTSELLYFSFALRLAVIG